MAGVLFEDAAEMGHVAVADQRGNVVDAAGGVDQQLLGALHPQGVDDVQKALLQVTVDELGQVPLTDVDVVGYVAQGQVLGVVLANVLHGRTGDESARFAGVFGGFGLWLQSGRRRGSLVQTGLHGGNGLPELLHVAGLEQIAAYAQIQGLLGIVEVPVGGEHCHLHGRKGAFQRGDHGQSIHVGHTDVCQQ